MASKHINRRHQLAKASRAKANPPTHRVIWDKVRAKSRAGVEHFHYRGIVIPA